MAGYIFLSYSQADRPYANQLAAHLDGNGIAVWHDFQVAVGSLFDREIQNHIDSCAAVIVIISPTSADSIWVSRELGYADDQRKPIFPLMLGPARAPLRLQGVQHEDVTGGRMPSPGFIARLRTVLAPPGSELDP